MRWTHRLKRFGGLKAIESIRLDQFQRLAKLGRDHRATKRKLEAAKGCFEWLQEHPLRVLGPDVQLYFGWRTL